MYQKYNFENLEVYQLARDLLKELYNLCLKFPKEEIFVLVSQIKRAGISVVLNVAEGSIKTKKEFAHFINIALGSLIEVKTSLIIAKDLGYITEEEFGQPMDKIDKVFFKLINLKKYLKK